MGKIENPLVSIIVITYNSSKFVLETLESAKAQTYNNIELIVSDDCSTDDTVKICSEWIKENKERFVHTELITIEKNSGIPANCNRGVKASKGEWVKLIAGDDTLISQCIEIFIDNSIILKEKIIFSNSYINDAKINQNDNYKLFFIHDAKKQYLELLKQNFLIAPASFIHKQVFENLDGFNEKYILLEDYPFYLKALKSGFKMAYIEYALVNYRKHIDNLSHCKNINIQYINSLINFYSDIYLKELLKHKLYFYYFNYLISLIYMYLVKLNIVKKWKTYRFIIRWFTPLPWKKRILNNCSKLPYINL